MQAGSIRRSSVGVIHRSLFSRAQDIGAVDEGPWRVVPGESFNRLVRRDECRPPACRVLSESMRKSVPNLSLHAVLLHLKSATQHCRHIGGGTRESYCYQRCRQPLHTGQPLRSGRRSRICIVHAASGPNLIDPDLAEVDCRFGGFVAHHTACRIQYKPHRDASSSEIFRLLRGNAKITSPLSPRLSQWESRGDRKKTGIYACSVPQDGVSQRSKVLLTSKYQEPSSFLSGSHRCTVSNPFITLASCLPSPW